MRTKLLLSARKITSALLGTITATRSWLGRNWGASLTILAFGCFLVNAATFYPGYMSTDSLSQYGQASGATPFADWHPPVMALVWKVLIQITGFTGSMLLFQLALIWGAVLLFALVLRHNTKRRWVSILPFGLALLPWVYGISGVIWKDVQMAFALLLAVAIVLYIREYAKRGKSRMALGIIAGLLILYAASLRYNALFAAMPIVLLLVGAWQVKRVWYVLAIPALLVGYVTVQAVVSHATRPLATHPESSVMLDDIINVESREEILGRNLPADLKQSLIEIKQCHREQQYLNLYWNCANDQQREVISATHYTEVRSLWVSVLVSDAPSYLLYRAQSFAWLLFAPGGVYMSHPGIDDNSYGLHRALPRLGEMMEYYTVSLSYNKLPALYEAWFWLVCSIGGLYFAIRRAKKYKQAILMLSLSSLVYIVSYFPVVVATDYRYVYWSVLALTVAGVLIIADWRSQARPTK